MKTTSLLILITAALVWGCSNNNESQTKPTKTGADTTQSAPVYQCPMDCEKGKTYEEKGKCPVCGMDLEQKVDE